MWDMQSLGISSCTSQSARMEHISQFSLKLQGDARDSGVESAVYGGYEAHGAPPVRVKAPRSPVSSARPSGVMTMIAGNAHCDGALV
jgi:hypothetical protein